MGRTYIGYGYTNAEGVATLDYDANGNQLPKKSYACHSRNTSVVAEASIDNVITASNSIRFCENYVPPSETLSLTADKNILSYADGDTVTLTATYDGTTIEGKSVVFKMGDTVLATETTDSNGVATYEYESQGVGDVTITAECMNLQETYELEDCYFYDTLTTDKQLFSIATGSGTLTYSNDGLTFRDSTSSETKVLFDKQLPTSDYEVSYDIVAYENTNNKPQVCFEDFFLGINNNGYYGRRVSASGNIWNETGSPTPPHTIKHKITGTSSKTVETYQNSTLLGTSTSINQTRVMQIFAYENGRSITFTNLKIKPL